MTWLETVFAYIAELAGRLSASTAVCFLLLCVFFFAAMSCIRGVVSGLFRMHRSKSALKKVYNDYTLGQKICLKHAWQECLHAKKFCRVLIVLHHCIFALLVAGLFLALLSYIWPALKTILAWFTVVFGTCVLFPVSVLTTALDQHPFNKRRNEFTFKKYHNTKNHESLW